MATWSSRREVVDPEKTRGGKERLDKALYVQHLRVTSLGLSSSHARLLRTDHRLSCREERWHPAIASQGAARCLAQLFLELTLYPNRERQVNDLQHLSKKIQTIVSSTRHACMHDTKY